MKSTTPIRDLTTTARAGLFGCWRKSIGVMVLCMLILIGIGILPIVGCVLLLVLAAPLVVGMHSYFLATVRRKDNPFKLLFAGFSRFGVAWRTYMLVMMMKVLWMTPFLIMSVVIIGCTMRLESSGFFGSAVPVLICSTNLALPLYVVMALAIFFAWIFVHIRYGLAFYVVADDASGNARQTVRRNVELMKGNYGRLALLWIRLVGWQRLCVLIFGISALLSPFCIEPINSLLFYFCILLLLISFIWLIPYVLATTAAFYDDLLEKRSTVPNIDTALRVAE